MRRLIILGAGGHGRVVADAARLTGLWQEIIFLDDKYPEITHSALWPIAGRLSDFAEQVQQKTEFIVAIGDNLTRMNWSKHLLSAGVNLATVIHPTAVVGCLVSLGAGSCVLAQAVINTGSKIGMAAILNSGSVIEHDCHLKDAVHVCPNAALGGGVTVGENSTIGIGSAVRHLVRIGNHVMIGAGSVVVSDIADQTVAAGIPARPMQNR